MLSEAVKTKEKQGGMFSLRKQILGFVITLSVLLLGVMIALQIIMVSSYRKKINSDQSRDAASYADNLGNSIRQMRDTVGLIYSSDSMMQGLYPYQSAVSRVDSMTNMLNLLKLQVKLNGNLGGLFVYYDTDKKPLYYVKESMSFKDKEIVKNAGRSAWDGSSDFMDYVITADEGIYYCVYISKQHLGFSGSVDLRTGIPEGMQSAETCGVIYKGVFYRTGGQEREISEKEAAAIKEGRMWLSSGSVVWAEKLDGIDMIAVKILPRNFWLYYSGVHIALFFLILLLLFFSRRLYRFTANQLALPLEDMTNTLQNIRGGVWEVDFSAENRITEIENVRQTVRVMLKEIEQYKIRTYEDEIDKQKIQLQFHQLQLAPHFYTNCLKNAYYMLMMKEYENAEEFLLCLSTHLRYLLQRDSAMVPVRTEKEFVQNYIKMQEILASRPLLYEISVEEDAEDYEIPILTLQTFVENSVKYGGGTKERPLQIQIFVRYLVTEEGSSLNITVHDNGPGYPAELLLALNQREVPKEKEMGVGIINLLSRLRLCCGEGISWYFDNRKGAFSEIILPVEGKEARR